MDTKPSTTEMVLALVDSMSQSDIARTVGVTRARVNQIVHRWRPELIKRRLLPRDEIVALVGTMTQDEIAAKYGCTRQRISQILHEKGAVSRHRSSPPPLNPDPSEVHRFWEKVQFSDGCWEWTGALSRGYGHVHPKGAAEQMGAHRYSYILHFGPLPPKWVVCHKCDNKACVRPDHLYAGTHSDNALDMHRKVA